MVSTRPGEWGFLCFLSWEYAQIIINHPNEAIFVLKQPRLTWVPHRKPPHLSAPGVEQRQFNSASLVPPACHTGCHTVQFNPELRLLEKWCATKKVPRLCPSCLLLMHLQHPWWWHLFSRTSPSWRVTRMAPASSVTSLRHAGEHRTMGHRPFQPWRDACRDPCWGSREIAGAVVSCRRPWKMPHPTSSRLLPMSCKAKALKLCQHLHANFGPAEICGACASQFRWFLAWGAHTTCNGGGGARLWLSGLAAPHRTLPPGKPQLASLLESVLSAVPQIEKLLKDPFGSNLPDFTGLVPMEGAGAQPYPKLSLAHLWQSAYVLNHCHCYLIVIAYAKVVCPYRIGQICWLT